MKDEHHFYQIIVEGKLDVSWSAWFDGLIVTWHTDAERGSIEHQTIFSGHVLDQAALRGLLNRILDLNLELVVVRRCTPPQLTLNLAVRVSDEQIALVQESLAQVGSRAGQMVTLFYDRLFEVDPSLRQLFQHERQEQERKFLAMLVNIVNGLPHLELLLPLLQGLGSRHASYGVQEEHYPLVEEVLLWTLAQVSGATWRPALVEAWTAAYRTLVFVMQEKV